MYRQTLPVEVLACKQKRGNTHTRGGRRQSAQQALNEDIIHQIIFQKY